MALKYFETYQQYQSADKKASDICFLEDNGSIYTHGNAFGGSEKNPNIIIPTQTSVSNNNITITINDTDKISILKRLIRIKLTQSKSLLKNATLTVADSSGTSLYQKTIYYEDETIRDGQIPGNACITGYFDSTSFNIIDIQTYQNRIFYVDSASSSTSASLEIKTVRSSQHA